MAEDWTNHGVTYRPCDLYGGGAKDHRVVKAHHDLAQLLLHVPMVYALCWGTDV